MRTVGRTLQITALIIPPLLIPLWETGGFSRGWQMLAALGGAVLIFGIGRLVEGYARS
jgi:hypothetical protein